MAEKLPDQFDDQERVAFPAGEESAETQQLFERHRDLSLRLLNLITDEGRLIADGITSEESLENLTSVTREEGAIIRQLGEIEQQVAARLKRTEGRQ